MGQKNFITKEEAEMALLERQKKNIEKDIRAIQLKQRDNAYEKCMSEYLGRYITRHSCCSRDFIIMRVDDIDKEVYTDYPLIRLSGPKVTLGKHLINDEEETYCIEFNEKSYINIDFTNINKWGDIEIISLEEAMNLVNEYTEKIKSPFNE